LTVSLPERTDSPQIKEEQYSSIMEWQRGLSLHGEVEIWFLSSPLLDEGRLPLRPTSGGRVEKKQETSGNGKTKMCIAVVSYEAV
jgi:hypothetical protein